jgi:hypothetical protein
VVEWNLASFSKRWSDSRRDVSDDAATLGLGPQRCQELHCCNPPEGYEGKGCALIGAIVFSSLNIGAALGELEVQT